MGSAIFLISHLHQNIDLVCTAKLISNFVIKVNIRVILGYQVIKYGLNGQFCHYLIKKKCGYQYYGNKNIEPFFNNKISKLFHNVFYISTIYYSFANGPKSGRLLHSRNFGISKKSIA